MSILVHCSYAAVIGVLILVAIVVPVVLLPLLPIILVYVHVHRTYAHAARTLQRAENVSRSPVLAKLQEWYVPLIVVEKAHLLSQSLITSLHCVQFGWPSDH